MSKSNTHIAREILGNLIRQFREEAGYGRVELSHKVQNEFQIAVSRKMLNRLEHASPRQERYHIEPVIKFLIPVGEKRTIAFELLNMCFPADDVAQSEEHRIPHHLLHTLVKPNRRKTRLVRRWPRRSHLHRTIAVHR